MKGILRSILAFGLAIFIIANFIGGISYGGKPQIILTASIALALGHMLIVPLINLLLLPINILTLGSLRWVSTVILLIVVTLVVPGFSIHSFIFPGISTTFITIPQIPINTFFSFIITSFLLSLISNFFLWFCD